jgi:hypothetical protein
MTNSRADPNVQWREWTCLVSRARLEGLGAARGIPPANGTIALGARSCHRRGLSKQRPRRPARALRST